MASDFNSCGFGAISPEMLVKSLLSGIQAFSACGIRTVAVNVSGKTLSSPHACSTAEDFWNLFLRSLVMADDDKVAIRTVYTSSANGAGLDTCGNCGDYFTVWETLQAIFIEDEDGLVYLNIVNIT